MFIFTSSRVCIYVLLTLFMFLFTCLCSYLLVHVSASNIMYMTPSHSVLIFPSNRSHLGERFQDPCFKSSSCDRSSESLHICSFKNTQFCRVPIPATTCHEPLIHEAVT